MDRPRHNNALVPSLLLLGLAGSWSCGGEPPGAAQRAGGVTRLLETAPVETLETEELEDPGALAGARRVELDDRLKDARLARPGESFALDVPSRPGSRLEVALGRLGEGGVLRFRVTGDGPSSENEVLVERHLTEQHGDSWHEVSLELPPELAGGRLQFEIGREVGSDAGEAPGGVVGVWGHPRIVEPRPEAPPSLLLISIDTLRADRLSLYGYSRPTTPHLERLAKDAAVFENAVAQAPWTVPSHRSLLTGLDPWRHGFNHDTGALERSLASRVETPMLAQRLRRAGYITAAETGGAYLDPAYGFGCGFESYGAWPRPERIDDELGAVVDRALAFDERHRDSPYFFFLHTYGVHDPYLCRSQRWEQLTDLEPPPPTTHIALLGEAGSATNGFRKVSRFEVRPPGVALEPTPELVSACYDAGVARMDAEIGRLLEGLRQRQGRRPLVVFTSDHGEALGEHGRVGHNRLEDSNLLVPLLIADPAGRGAGRRIERQVRLVDLLPTLLELLGQPAAEGIDGVSLVPFLDGREVEVPPAWSYSASGNRGIALRHGNRLKAIFQNTVWTPARTGLELFDLRRDPAELDPLDDPRTAETVRSTIDAAFSAGAVGLRLELRNAGTKPLAGELRGPPVRLLGLKSTDLDCDCLEFLERYEARFEVPPGETYTLHFEIVVGQRLVLEARGGGPAAEPLNFGVAPGELEGVAARRLRGGRWGRLERRLEDGETGFAFWWHGIGPVSAEDTGHDPELRRQLESLGYL